MARSHQEPQRRPSRLTTGQAGMEALPQRCEVADSASQLQRPLIDRIEAVTAESFGSLRNGEA